MEKQTSRATLSPGAPRALPPENFDELVRWLRAEFRNDGAEGESIWRICDEAVRLRDRAEKAELAAFDARRVGEEAIRRAQGYKAELNAQTARHIAELNLHHEQHAKTVVSAQDHIAKIEKERDDAHAVVADLVVAIERSIVAIERYVDCEDEDLDVSTIDRLRRRLAAALASVPAAALAAARQNGKDL